MACPPCWQQRQVFVSAMRQGDAYLMAQAAMRGVHIATDKYIRGIDVTRKYGGMLAQNPREPRTGYRVR